MKIVKSAVIALGLVSALSVAIPQYEQEILYFSDSSMTEIVGMGTLTCTKGLIITDGQRTSYKKVFLSTPCNFKGVGKDVVFPE